MPDRLRTIVATANDSTWQDLSAMLEPLNVDVSRADSVAQCKHIFCRDRVDLVFCDESLDDGNYWDVYRAVTIGLIVKPKVILMARNLGYPECEQAKQCGIFAVIESPCRKSAVEWTILLAKRSARDPKDRLRSNPRRSSTSFPARLIATQCGSVPFAASPTRASAWSASPPNGPAGTSSSTPQTAASSRKPKPSPIRPPQKSRKPIRPEVGPQANGRRFLPRIIIQSDVNPVCRESDKALTVGNDLTEVL